MKIIEEIPTEFQRIIVEVGKSSTDHYYLLSSLRNILLAAMQNFGGTFFETLNCLSALSEENLSEFIATKSANYDIFILQINANLAGLRALLIWSAAHYISIPGKVDNKGIIGQNIDEPYTASTGAELSYPSWTSVNGNNHNSPISLLIITKNNCGGNILFFDLFCRQIQQIWKVLTRVRVHLKRINNRDHDRNHNHNHIHIHNQGNEKESNSVRERESRESYMTLSTNLQDIILYQCNMLNELLLIRTPTLTLTITTTIIQHHQQHQLHQLHHDHRSYNEYHGESLRITKAIYTAFTVILNGWETVLQFNGNENGIKEWNEELLKHSTKHNTNMKIECPGMTHKESFSIRLLEHSGVIGYGNQGFTAPAFLAGLIDLTAGFTERHTVNGLSCLPLFVSSCLPLSFLVLSCLDLS